MLTFLDMEFEDPKEYESFSYFKEIISEWALLHRTSSTFEKIHEVSSLTFIKTVYHMLRLGSEAWEVKPIYLHANQLDSRCHEYIEWAREMFAEMNKQYDTELKFSTTDHFKYIASWWDTHPFFILSDSDEHLLNYPMDDNPGKKVFIKLL